MKNAGLIALVALPLLFACFPKKPEIPMTAVPAGPLLQELERHRQSFSGLKALASVEIVKRGRKRTFDSAGIVIDHQRRLRVEAYGPLGESVMAVVWDGQDILLRLPEEGKVTRPGPTGLERLLGQGMEASELCAVLSGNIPKTGEAAAAMLLCGENRECNLELRSNDVLRQIRVSYPVVGSGREPRIRSYELFRSGKLMFRARFDRVEEISHYPLPMQIVIENPGNKLQLTVLYSEVELNTPIRDETFTLTDETGNDMGK